MLYGMLCYAQVEYTYSFHTTVFKHRNVLLRLPPPFNLPQALWELGRRWSAYRSSVKLIADQVSGISWSPGCE